MKRPWLCIAAWVALGEATAYILGDLWLIAISLPAILATGGFLWMRTRATGNMLLPRPRSARAYRRRYAMFFIKQTDKRRALIVMCIAFLFGIFLIKVNDALTLRRSSLTEAAAKDTAATLSLTVDDIELKPERAVLTCGRVIIYCDYEKCPDIKHGNTIDVTGKFTATDAARNPGEFNYRLYYRSVGITHSCFADKIVVTDTHTRIISQWVFELRQNMLSHISSIYDENDAGVLRAALLGDKTLLDDDILKLYQRSGFAHLLAISGLHVGIMGMTLYKLLRQKMKLSFLLSGIIASVLIAAYSILTGNGVSTVRATLMLILIFAAGTLGRKNDLLNSAGLSALCILVISPYQLFTCGFMLSFAAVLAIGGPANHVIKELEIKSSLLIALITSTCISLFLLPITAYFFFEIPLYATFINLIVIPLMTYVVWSGIIATVLSYILPPLAVIAAGSGHYILQLYTFIGNLSQKLPFASITVGRPKAWQIIVYYLFFFAFLYLSPSKIQELKSHLSTSVRETAST